MSQSIFDSKEKPIENEKKERLNNLYVTAAVIGILSVELSFFVYFEGRFSKRGNYFNNHPTFWSFIFAFCLPSILVLLSVFAKHRRQAMSKIKSIIKKNKQIILGLIIGGMSVYFFKSNNNTINIVQSNIIYQSQWILEKNDEISNKPGFVNILNINDTISGTFINKEYNFHLLDGTNTTDSIYNGKLKGINDSTKGIFSIVFNSKNIIKITFTIDGKKIHFDGKPLSENDIYEQMIQDIHNKKTIKIDSLGIKHPIDTNLTVEIGITNIDTNIGVDARHSLWS